ncbi:hypothetical protein, partial [Salmonella sp. s51090]|uniref:hypothetical protein n=1 Tax=Salmonella sp. s51090 TaxID=3159651 RepID=UPI0039808AC5
GEINQEHLSNLPLNSSQINQDNFSNLPNSSKINRRYIGPSCQTPPKSTKKHFLTCQNQPKSTNTSG